MQTVQWMEGCDCDRCYFYVLASTRRVMGELIVAHDPYNPNIADADVELLSSFVDRSRLLKIKSYKHYFLAILLKAFPNRESSGNAFLQHMESLKQRIQTNSLHPQQYAQKREAHSVKSRQIMHCE